MYCLGPILFLLLTLQPWRTADADCCRSTYTRFEIPPRHDCKNYLDSTRFFWTDSCFRRVCDNLEDPTPCCGVGSCNIFCCNCDDGCKPGNIPQNLQQKFGDNITVIAPENKTIKIVVNGSTIYTGPADGVTFRNGYAPNLNVSSDSQEKPEIV